MESMDMHGFRGYPWIPWIFIASMDIHRFHGYPWNPWISKGCVQLEFNSIQMSLNIRRGGAFVFTICFFCLFCLGQQLVMSDYQRYHTWKAHMPAAGTPNKLDMPICIYILVYIYIYMYMCMYVYMGVSILPASERNAQTRIPRIDP